MQNLKPTSTLVWKADSTMTVLFQMGITRTDTSQTKLSIIPSKVKEHAGAYNGTGVLPVAVP